MKKPVLGILLEFGFHEIKKYLHSHLYVELAKTFDLVWLALNKNNDEFENYFKQTGFPFIYLNVSEFPQKLVGIEKYNNAIRKHWMLKNNLGLFHNYAFTQTKSLKSTVVGNQYLKNNIESKTLNLIEKKYYSEAVEKIYSRYQVNKLLFNSYSTSFAKTMAVTAFQMNIETYLLINSWKDIFINNFIPFRFLKHIYVWNEEMKMQCLQHMPYIKTEQIKVTGNPALDSLLFHQPKFTKEYYASKYNLNIQSKWIYYTMMSAHPANDEIDTINLISKTLLASDLYDYQILVRRNPNHPSEAFINFPFQKNTILTQHYCTYNATQDLNIQTEEGEQEWLDLVHYSYCNMSIPSTVTLEFLSLNKPVYNIAFNAQGIENKKLERYFEAQFYKPLFEQSEVKKIDAIHQLISTLKKIIPLNRNAHPKLSSPLLASYLNE